jgi:hypothetical protein
MATTTLLSILIGVAGVTGEPSAPAETSWIELFPGKELSAWRESRGQWMMVGETTTDPADAKRLAWKPGARVALNGPQGRTVDLVTAQEFGDIEIHVEFMIPKGSNSGVYFMGRYEIQVYDSHGVAKDKYPGIECGGVYPRWIDKENVGGHSPRVNASLPPGQWQTFDVVFRAPRFDRDGKKTRNARFVKAVHNGKVIHENVEVAGPTRAALLNDEKVMGPIMLQGDHGPVAYRNVRVRPLPPE